MTKPDNPGKDKPETCSECRHCKDIVDGFGDCHSLPPEPIGKFNEQDSKDIRNHLTNGHKEAERCVWRKVKITDAACGSGEK